MRTCERLDAQNERRMNTERATPEVIDALAGIEIQRQEREKESGVPVSCNWALGKLYGLLPGKRRSPGMKTGRPPRAKFKPPLRRSGGLGNLARLRAAPHDQIADRNLHRLAVLVL